VGHQATRRAEQVGHGVGVTPVDVAGIGVDQATQGQAVGEVTLHVVHGRRIVGPEQDAGTLAGARVAHSVADLTTARADLGLGQKDQGEGDVVPFSGGNRGPMF
jgi:hypothetical protein